MKSKDVNDYSVSRVPKSVTYPMWKIMIVRLGALACVNQFMLGAELGAGMSLWKAFWATVVGSLILQFISLGLGIAGQKERLPSSLLSKWTGFGSVGSSIVALLSGISMIGWFGIQNSVLAQGIISSLHRNLNFPIIAIITGAIITLIVILGMKGLSWTANITVPAFLLVMAWATFKMLKSHSLIRLAIMNGPGKPLSFTAAVTMITGSFIIGCITMPDFTRYTRSSKDVFWITFVSIFVGELGINLISVLMAHAVGTSQIMPIIYKFTGSLGVILVTVSTLKINDANLYSSSLDFANFIVQFIHKNINRGVLTLIIGTIGTILSAIGIANDFSSFLSLLGVVFPPIAGIMFIDYFVLKRDRRILYESRLKNELPSKSEKINIITLIAWVLGSLTGGFLHVGIQSITSILVAAVVYYVGMKIKGLAERN